MTVGGFAIGLNPAIKQSLDHGDVSTPHHHDLKEKRSFATHELCNHLQQRSGELHAPDPIEIDRFLLIDKAFQCGATAGIYRRRRLFIRGEAYVSITSTTHHAISQRHYSTLQLEVTSNHMKLTEGVAEIGR
jgi:hypothetical protein